MMKRTADVMFAVTATDEKVQQENRRCTNITKALAKFLVIFMLSQDWFLCWDHAPSPHPPSLLRSPLW